MKMKKILLLFIIFISINVYANNKIYDISVDVYVDKNAIATITEIWKVKGEDGTEWYKPLRNLGESKLTNFNVSMDGIPLTEKKWNTKESLNDKKGYYGINYTDTDTELCFGKYDFNEHTFTLKYNLDNYIFNTDDAQVLYWTYFSKFQNIDFQKMSITIRSYYSFPNNLDVWGYGYKGYAYVKDGVISLSNEENTTMNNNYVVALVKFPPETFSTDYRSINFNTFEEVLNNANQDTFQYDYDDINYSYNYSPSDSTKYIPILFFGFLSTISIVTIYSFNTHGYGYKDNKKISKKEILPFRDIPCNKDFYYANTLIYLNNFQYQSTNILSAIILNWLRKGRISIDNQNKIQTIIFNKNKLQFDNPNEEKLYNLMYSASDKGNLDTKKFKKWARNHYSSFLKTLEKFNTIEINKLQNSNHIYHRKDKKECKKKMVMDDYIYEDSKKLYGLKIFLDEFSSMNTKASIEVHLWDEYLIFASLFGIADKVAKQLQNLYPDIYSQHDFDYSYIYFINNISKSSVNAASSARSAARSYSSGGGGFSSGGGGGGSFGGGGFSGGGSR